ncbi:MAG: helix-turn-helix transcriptional regulator [Candidatus Cryptobacteroides sp.]
MVAELLDKYIWLTNTILRSADRGMSLDEIASGWKSRFGTEYSRRTFNNHRECIESIFGVSIECDRSSNRYRIRKSGDILDGHSAWLIDSFATNTLLSQGKNRLAGRISVEEIPSGHIYLTAIMDAMLDGRVLKVKYRKYQSDNESVYNLRPYALKESSRRWYLVAWCEEREATRVYALDRMTGLEQTGKTFAMPENFDVESLFATSYGIYLTQEKPCTIVFEARGKEVSYLRDLPIHRSQKEISTENGRSTFSIFVSPDRELLMELCSHGSGITVISPEYVRDAVRGELESALKSYGEDRNECFENMK